jgi:GDP-4-dehydro-6-deoxy-D-mannose reductase
VQKCDFGEAYNVCSGKARTMQDMLDMLLDMTDVKVEVKQDPARMRPSDVPLLVGDSSKFRKKTGWKPTIAYEKTLEDTLNYWRERV